MALAPDEVAELVAVYPDARVASEGGQEFVLIPGLELPEGVAPVRVDALLCPTPRDGYPSRLFYGTRPQNAPAQFRNVRASHVLGRTWHACSWRVRTGLRLVQLVRAHLDALKRPAAR